MKLNVATARPTRAWMDRFADELQLLKPELSGVEASRLAAAAASLPQYVSTDPESAAATYCVDGLNGSPLQTPRWRDKG